MELGSAFSCSTVHSSTRFCVQQKPASWAPESVKCGTFVFRQLFRLLFRLLSFGKGQVTGSHFLCSEPICWV